MRQVRCGRGSITVLVTMQFFLTILGEILINATSEQIWKALTGGERHSRWFPLSAKATPGDGGTVFLSGGEWEAEARITKWEPGKRWSGGLERIFKQS
jgi:hypothetical protein